MRPSEVRRRVLTDHQKLREMLLTLEKLAAEVIEGEPWIGGVLRLEGEAVFARFLDHLTWENEHLRPLLLESDSRDGGHALRLDNNQREQRELLQYALTGLRDPKRPPLIIARNLLDLVRLLRHDMDDEEEMLLDV